MAPEKVVRKTFLLTHEEAKAVELYRQSQRVPLSTIFQLKVINPAMDWYQSQQQEHKGHAS